MISSNFEFKEFSDTAKGLDNYCVIHLANKEATEVERLMYRKKKRTNDFDEQKLFDYAKALKNLIGYIRYEVKPKTKDNATEKLLKGLYQEI